MSKHASVFPKAPNDLHCSQTKYIQFTLRSIETISISITYTNTLVIKIVGD